MTKIGDTFSFNGKIFRVEPEMPHHRGDGCRGCYFDNNGCSFKLFKQEKCSGNHRDDRMNVIFKEVKEHFKI